MILHVLWEAPVPTVVLACAAALLSLLLWFYGLRHWWRWERAIRDLGKIRTEHLAEPEYANLDHRQIHARFREIKSFLDELLAAAPAGALVLRPILDEVTQYRTSAVIGGESGWSDLVTRHVERLHRPLRWMRAAAGWVVLLGLAGTVLGFVDALPRLSAALSAGAKAAHSASLREVKGAEGPEEVTDPAKQSAASEVDEVFRSLGGVFLATLSGVCSALWLYCWATVFERRYEKLASEVEILGRRWFVPLMQSPDTVLDEAVRKELGEYFIGLSQQLVGALSPLVHQFSEALGRMSVVADDFSANIARGSQTLGAFQTAVDTLHISARETGSRLIEATEMARQFLHHLQKLRQLGDDKLVETAGLLAIPSRSLAGSAEGLRKTLESVEQGVEKISTAAVQIADSHKAEVDQLRKFEEQLGRVEVALAGNTTGSTWLSDTLDRGAQIQEKLLPELRRFADAAPELASLRREIPEIERLLSNQEARLSEVVSAVLGLQDFVIGTLDARFEPRVEQFVRESFTREKEAAEKRREVLELLQSSLSQLLTEVRTVGATAAHPDASLISLLREVAEHLRISIEMNQRAFASLESLRGAVPPPVWLDSPQDRREHEAPMAPVSLAPRGHDPELMADERLNSVAEGVDRT
ncbi:MAG TPA: hypothetical protein VIA62_15330 [Thermoanaerobaculia bacterium]|jgi:hypothetical protein|nr:hypothetical protein [Thermoanaerobaculia bacterium]